MSNTQCHNCEYQWKYSGELNMSTCPSCGLKTETNDIEEAEA